MAGVRVPTLALLLGDVASVLVFVAIGRSVHGHGDAIAGIVSTAWPFLTGLVAGWAASRAWRSPARLVPAGVAAWLGAAALGMVVRVLAGQGTKFPFILVTLGFLGATMLGWRAVARAVGRAVASARARA